MPDIHDLPAVNASLNALAALLLVTGYVLIRRRRWIAHRNVMTAALVVLGPVPHLVPDLPRHVG